MQVFGVNGQTEEGIWPEAQQESGKSMYMFDESIGLLWLNIYGKSCKFLIFEFLKQTNKQNKQTNTLLFGDKNIFIA
jgi:hypothetical protein